VAPGAGSVHCTPTCVGNTWSWAGAAFHTTSGQVLRMLVYIEAARTGMGELEPAYRGHESFRFSMAYPYRDWYEEPVRQVEIQRSWSRICVEFGGQTWTRSARKRAKMDLTDRL